MGDEVARMIAEGYDRVADAYAALESPNDPWPRMRRVRAFAAGLAAGSRVLDLGCGNGVPATLELAERHAVTAVDVSPEQAARARRNVPAAAVVCADVWTLALAPASFDAVLALYLVDNIPAAELSEVLRRVLGWLRPGGRLLLSAEPLDEGLGGVHEWLGVPMFIDGMPRAELLRTVRSAGFDILDAEDETQREGGRPIEFVWVTARRPPD
jgi:SAM-dependent methyltransferase